jgi:hypothetical protein
MDGAPEIFGRGALEIGGIPGAQKRGTWGTRLGKTGVGRVRPGGVVSSLGLEPRTHALKGRCSTN